MCFGLKPGEKYPPSVRHFCLALRYHSPRAYNQVRQEFGNKLPHENTIRQWILNSDSKGDPGIDESHMKKLKNIATEFEQKNGVPLLCSLVFDEINIRRQIFWSAHTSKYVGFVENKQSNQTDELNKPMCRQAIVFLLNGLNGYVEFPVAFYFIDSLNKIERSELLLQIIAAVSETGVKITNTTCDGLSSNISMYEVLGVIWKNWSETPLLEKEFFTTTKTIK